MKEKISTLAANALAAFMDFGIGTAIASVIAAWYGVHLSWQLVFVGGILSLVPDFDLVPSVFFGVCPTFDHRQTLFHRPLLVLPLVIVLAFVFGGQMWALIAGLCVLGHYLHDTNFLSTDYGIAWLWPFSQHYWSTFGAFTPLPHETGSHAEWLRENWLRPSFLSLREIGVGIIGLSVAVWFQSGSFLYVGALWALTFVTIGMLWLLQPNTINN